VTWAATPKSSLWDRVAEILDPTPDPEFDDPVLWAANKLDWTGSFYQAECLLALGTHKRVCIRGPHGLGKTTIAAIALLWFADTRDRAGIDWKVVATAGAWRQLTHYLMPEVHKWAKKMKHREFTRYELLTIELKLRYGRAFAVASDDPQNIEGAHADNILYIIDEAKSVIPGTWDAVEGAMSTGVAYALAISTPGKAQGRFFDIQTRAPGTQDWWVKHVTLSDAIKAGRVSKQWAEARRLQWGELSPVYVNRVMGDFSTTDQEGVIPLEWVERAQERYADLLEAEVLRSGEIINVSTDVSSTGGDATITGTRRRITFAGKDYDVISELVELDGRTIEGQSSTMVKTGKIVERLELGDPKKIYAVVDVIGVGTGVVDRLRELKWTVDAFNGSSGIDKTDRSKELHFLNRRAWAWWNLRDLLDPTFGSLVAFPDDDRLTGDLTSPKWEQTSSGKIKVEEKDEIRKRLGRSPDHGDTVVMSYAGKSPRSQHRAVAPISLDQKSMWNVPSR
jgi:hypothetical protein